MQACSYSYIAIRPAMIVSVIVPQGGSVVSKENRPGVPCLAMALQHIQQLVEDLAK
jgi:hypothetical protein